MITGGAWSPRHDLGVVRDHIVDALAGHVTGVLPGLLDCFQVAWPARCCRRVASLLEQL